MAAKIARLAVCVLIASVTAGCGVWKAPRITVVNDSPSVVSNVVLSGKGFSQTIGSIGPNQSVTVTVKPEGGSNVSMEADTPVRQIKARGLGYLEPRGGFRVQITITGSYNIETLVDVDTML